MGKVMFLIRYDIIPSRREEYLSLVKELKNIVKAEGLESYSVFQIRKKKNSFQEVYIFTDNDSYENFDDNSNERIDILMTKLSEMIQENSTEYSTLFEVNDQE